MNPVKKVQVTVTFKFDYTDTANQMIEDKEIECLDHLKDILRDWMSEDIQYALSDGIDDNIKIVIKE